MGQIGRVLVPAVSGPTYYLTHPPMEALLDQMREIVLEFGIEAEDVWV